MLLTIIILTSKKVAVKYFTTQDAPEVISRGNLQSYLLTTDPSRGIILLMSELLDTNTHYNRIAKRVGEWHRQAEALADKHLDSAAAFRQAMAETADELGEEYATDFRQRLEITQREGGWPHPDLLAELKQRNPAGMENFLDRFEAVAEAQRETYDIATENLIASIVSNRQPGVDTEHQPRSKWSRIRKIAQAAFRMGDTIRL